METKEEMLKELKTLVAAYCKEQGATYSLAYDEKAEDLRLEMLRSDANGSKAAGVYYGPEDFQDQESPVTAKGVMDFLRSAWENA